MITSNPRPLTIHLDRQKLFQIITILPLLIIALSVLTDTVVRNIAPIPETTRSQGQDKAILIPDSPVKTYPISGSELNPNLFSIQLPPPPLDALPYDVREPLSNGTSVPVKKRWIWVPSGQQITISEDSSGELNVNIPEGTLWWKEFYVETDRGTFLIERRIIARVNKTTRNPEGWMYYSSHHLPPGVDSDSVQIISSTSNEAAAYMLQPNEWLPTRQEDLHLEIRFEDARGVQYPYVFPGQIQCMACHGGATGAYPNADTDPIFIFGLHPNNLTPASFTALVGRGWLTNGDKLLNPVSMPNTPTEAPSSHVPLDTLTEQVVSVLRNNCASCHNGSSYSAANFTAFKLDPNYNYSTEELIALLEVNGMMIEGALPLVTPGSLEQSELWLRLNGLDGRRRMPPFEGGLPDIDPEIVSLLENWIVRADGR
jgi:hypothetical protein